MKLDEWHFNWSEGFIWWSSGQGEEVNPSIGLHYDLTDWLVGFNFDIPNRWITFRFLCLSVHYMGRNNV